MMMFMMKILLTTISPNLESELDPRFGRGAYFLMIDPESLEWNAVANPAVNAPGGAGVQAAQFAKDNDCGAVVSGDFGPNAFDAFKAAGIPMYLYGSCWTVTDVLERFKKGQLETPGAFAPGRRRGHGRMH